MLAITLTGPPQCSQVKMSILNTRFNRCAHVIETRQHKSKIESG